MKARKEKTSSGVQRWRGELTDRQVNWQNGRLACRLADWQADWQAG